jgi:hypothetical protein
MDTDLVEPSYVTVVNRTQQRREFMGFGRMHVFQPGEERAISRTFAEWVFTRTNGPMLAHTDQGYLHWLGIKAGPDELVGLLPETVFDTTPLQPVDALEGWDTSNLERDPEKTKVLKTPLLRADFANQGGSVAGIMGAPGRVLKT